MKVWNLIIVAVMATISSTLAQTECTIDPSDPNSGACPSTGVTSQFCQLSTGTCLTNSATWTGQCAPIPESGACTTDLNQVCGCDGITYNNECQAHRAGKNVAKAGSCAGDDTPAPSQSPTEGSTPNPTPSPIESTPEPTQSPTPGPSPSPVESTPEPTPAPTPAPSPSPTESTPEPSPDPTPGPSPSPTPGPSRAPTAEPTVKPTPEPTTMSPSQSPVTTPTTDSPTTAEPSLSPSRKPTAKPSVSPSVKPSVSPSKKPTVSPTKQPTKNPTRLPTKRPTRRPTKEPTEDPTPFPSYDPTISPSLSPTRKPTSKPTASPSVTPTFRPSRNPVLGTASPSYPPTEKPSKSPTPPPTASPSVSPTTAAPSVSPTLRPSKAPVIGTKSPSVPPTDLPSKSPVVTASPTQSPVVEVITPSPTQSPVAEATTPGPTPAGTSSPTTPLKTPEPTEGLSMSFSGIDSIPNQEEWTRATENFWEVIYNDRDDIRDVVVSIAIDNTVPSTSGGRRLNQQHRGLQEGVSVEVFYTQTMAYRGDTDLTMGDLVVLPLSTSTDRDEYVGSLKGFDGYEDLTEVSEISISDDSGDREPGGGEDGTETSDGDGGLGIGAIIGIACAGAAVLVFIIGFAYYRTKNKDEDGNDPNSTLAGSSTQDATQTATGAGTGSSVPTYGDTSVATVDYDYSRAYGGAGAHSLSDAGGTLGSRTRQTAADDVDPTMMPPGSGNTIFSDDQTFDQAYEDVREELLDVYAPAGKLGVVIDTPDDGAPVVHAVKDSSPIADKVQVGDKLVAVDDEDVRAMTAIKVSKLISRKSNNASRKLTIIRHVSNN